MSSYKLDTSKKREGIQLLDKPQKPSRELRQALRTLSDVSRAIEGIGGAQKLASMASAANMFQRRHEDLMRFAAPVPRAWQGAPNIAALADSPFKSLRPNYFKFPSSFTDPWSNVFSIQAETWGSLGRNMSHMSEWLRCSDHAKRLSDLVTPSPHSHVDLSWLALSHGQNVNDRPDFGLRTSSCGCAIHNTLRTGLEDCQNTGPISSKADYVSAIGIPLFSDCGDTFEVSFKGKSRHIKKSIGMKYLKLLVENPGKNISSLELLCLENGLSCDSAPKLVVLSDDQGMMPNLRQSLYENDQELQIAKENNDFARMERLQEARKALLDEVSEIQDSRKRIATDNPEFEKARKSVLAAITRAYKRLNDKFPELEGHFRVTITPGYYCSYDRHRVLH